MTLQTDPSGGVPAALRRRPALDADPKGHAAGILFVAPDGDVLLLRRSQAEENYAGHWALPGGKAEDGESPELCAEREAAEEMGRKPDGAGKVFDRRITPTGMAFHTFAYPVADKFAPRLNGEHSGYAWAPLDQLPRPLHPGVEATLTDRLGVSADMTPEAWSGLREGFLKWTLEEEREDEHAEDRDDDWGPDREAEMTRRTFERGFEAIVRKLDEVGGSSRGSRQEGFGGSPGSEGGGGGDAALALDRDTVRTFDRDGRLRIATAHISKANVCPYRGREIPDFEKLGLEPERIYQLLRDPDELEKAAATFNGIQVLREHKPVDAEDHKPWDIVGTTATEATFADPYLDNGLVIWTRDAIDDIESEAKKELSCGYHYKADMTPGNFRGMRYDGVMRDIVGNHVALVKDGRAGPDVVVGDSAEGIMDNRDLAKKLNALSMRQISIGALAAYLKPRLAKDQKIDLAMAFDGVPVGPGFKAAKPKIATSIKTQAKDKLAKDASLDDVEKVLDMLDGHEIQNGTNDESVSKEQHNAMAAAAQGTSDLEIPKAVGEEFAKADTGKKFGDAFPEANEFLKGKLSGDDFAEFEKRATKKDATDEDPEEKKKREAAEAEKKAADEKADKDKDEEKKAMDAKLASMVTKTAMDEAIRTATESVRKTEQGIRAALSDVQPWVGELPKTMAFDSGAAVYRHALGMLGVAGAKDLHESALKTVLDLQPKPGAQPVARNNGLALDAAGIESFTKRFPGSEKIGLA